MALPFIEAKVKGPDGRASVAVLADRVGAGSRRSSVMREPTMGITFVDASAASRFKASGATCRSFSDVGAMS